MIVGAGQGDCITAIGFVASVDNLVSNFNYVSQAICIAAWLTVNATSLTVMEMLMKAADWL